MKTENDEAAAARFSAMSDESLLMLSKYIVAERNKRLEKLKHIQRQYICDCGMIGYGREVRNKCNNCIKLKKINETTFSDELKSDELKPDKTKFILRVCKCGKKFSTPYPDKVNICLFCFQYKIMCSKIWEDDK